MPPILTRLQLSAENCAGVECRRLPNLLDHEHRLPDQLNESRLAILSRNHPVYLVIQVLISRLIRLIIQHLYANASTFAILAYVFCCSREMSDIKIANLCVIQMKYKIEGITLHRQRIFIELI